jgi:exonuclease III
MTLKLASYNCRGLPRNPSRLFERPCLLNIINDEELDIICLQETWLAKQDLWVLNSLSSNFSGTGCTSTNYEDGFIHGHPPGGVAIMWKNSISSAISIIDSMFSWLCAIRLDVNQKSHIITCVYLPYEKRDNEELFLQNLGELNAFIEDLDCQSVQIVGDFNADTSDCNSSFAQHLSDFCQDYNLIISTLELLLHQVSHLSVTCGTPHQ